MLCCFNLPPAPPPAPAGALAELSRLRSVLIMAPGSLSECLALGPGLPRLTALEELQVRRRPAPPVCAAPAARLFTASACGPASRKAVVAGACLSGLC